MKDIQNLSDSDTFTLLTENGVLVGYCPGYFIKDLTSLLDTAVKNQVKFTVEKINPDAPSHYRLLCNLDAPWVEEVKPCSQPEFQTIVPMHHAKLTSG